MTSMSVNLQHLSDAAQLLRTLEHVNKLFNKAKDGIMSVHDAMYLKPDLAIASKGKYDELAVDIAANYDYMSQAINEVKETQTP
jgi:hypothetical protein